MLHDRHGQRITVARVFRYMRHDGNCRLSSSWSFLHRDFCTCGFDSVWLRLQSRLEYVLEELPSEWNDDLDHYQESLMADTKGEAFDYRAATLRMLDRAKELTTAIELLCEQFSTETGLPIHAIGIRSKGDAQYQVQVNLGLPTQPDAPLQRSVLDAALKRGPGGNA